MAVQLQDIRPVQSGNVIGTYDLTATIDIPDVVIDRIVCRDRYDFRRGKDGGFDINIVIYRNSSTLPEAAEAIMLALEKIGIVQR